MAADWAEGVYRLTFCEWDRAREVIEHGVSLGESSGAHYELGIGITILGFFHSCYGTTGEAIGVFRSGLHSARTRGNKQHESWALTMLVPLLLAREEDGEALRVAGEAGSRLATSDPLSVPIFHGVHAQALARAGRFDEALEAAHRSLLAFAKAPPAGYIYLPGLTGPMEVATEELRRPGGDRARGALLARQTMGIVSSFATLFPFARPRAATMRAWLEEARGRKERAAALYGKGLAAAERVGLRWDQAAARAGIGRLRGDAAMIDAARFGFEEVEDLREARRLGGREVPRRSAR
jgi:hypothetical protein